MTNKLLLLFPILACAILKINADTPSSIAEYGHCMMYGIGAVNPQKDSLQYLNLRYEGEAQPLYNTSAISTLQGSCPELMDEITDEDGIVKTCCSHDNIAIMANQLSMLEGVLDRCPSCLSNIRKSFCFFACHPRQSAFTVATEMFEDGVSIYAVAMYMSNMYTDDAYYSCENVYYPALNDKALQLLCGPYGVENCSPQNLFNYFGNNEFAPFNITYIYDDEPVTITNLFGNETLVMEPFNPATIPCSSNETEWHCLCSDCEQSCPEPPEPSPPKSHVYVGDWILYTFLCTLIALILAVSYIIVCAVCGLPGNEIKNGVCICQQKIAAKMEHFLQNIFQWWGTCVARRPFTTISFGILLIVIFSAQATRIQMTVDPVELWASPESRSRLEKDHYDETFGPFYRTNQLIITTNEAVKGFHLNISDTTTGISQSYDFGPVFDPDFMTDVMDLQIQLMELLGEWRGLDITLNNICNKPLAPQNNECLIQSIMNYWQNDADQLASMMTPEDPYYYAEFFLTCTSNPTYYGYGEQCMGTYGGPVLPYVALGGYLMDNETISESPNYEESTALVITFIVNNHLNESFLGPAKSWEKSFLDFLERFEHPNMSIAYYSERSLEDEIAREGKSDITTIIISYTVMFAYVTLALGSLNFDHCSRLCIETKLWLGFCSVLVVFLSFVTAVGFCALVQIQGTLFVLEVIPFLVLAVGVDNVFLMVQTWMREKKFDNESVEEHVGRVVGRVAPSMLLATTSETVCFFLGGLSQMPAVHSFAIYAGFAILINFLLQLTVLVALITLDARRLKANRYDVCCCYEGPAAISDSSEGDCCYNIFEDLIAPFLMIDIVRVLILIVFTLGFFTGLIYARKVSVGLEQDVGMPSDSYLIKYFDYLNEYLSVGPPIYFVVKSGYDYTLIENQNLVCGTSGCNDDSMLTQIYVQSLSPDISLIATGATSWLDSYFSYIADDGGGSAPYACCRLDENGTFIDSSVSFDTKAVDTCLHDEDFYEGTQRPLPEKFMPNLPYFLKDNPHGTSCSQAGHPAYGPAVKIIDIGGKWFNKETAVGGNYFMAYHTILRHSADFTEALEKAYNLTDVLTEYLRSNSTSPDIEVYPYSIFYVYYEQYLSMWSTTGVSLSISFASVYLVLFTLSGFDFVGTTCNITVVIMIVTDIIGCMTPWNIQLNAISLVNLVMATGISVEFCSHITHAFVNITEGSKKDRAKRALAYTGSSVFSGITLTKFGGIVVLAFANSQVIQIFYFRMYMLIVLFGALHGLIFLPVLLSLVGPNINPFLKKEGNTTKGKSDVNRPKIIDGAIRMKVRNGDLVEYDEGNINDGFY